MSLIESPGTAGQSAELASLDEPRRRRVLPMQRRLLIALGVGTTLVALQIARLGTPPSRAAAFALIGLSVAVSVTVWWRERRRTRSLSSFLRSVLGAGDPIATRLSQAARLLEPNQRNDGTSQALAELHWRRTLAVVDRRRLEQVARLWARRLGVATGGLALVVVLLLLLRGFSMFEGAGVLFSRAGVAPIELQYVRDLNLHIRPPDYLRAEARSGRVDLREAAPKGSLLTFRAEEVHPGRELFLFDGESEVPFVDDGAGQIVARYPLEHDVELRVMARFGAVRIFDARRVAIDVVLDRAPEVQLEGAPKTLKLADEELREVQIRYEAEDDHGLREVHLVLRSGTREERRTLARLDGNTKRDRGGYVLHLKDGFIARSYAPVLVTVEAKDNDPIDGPKWGSSEAITLVPPELGEAEAMRIDALRALRDRVVDTLASAMAPIAKGPAMHVQARALYDRAVEDEGALINLVLAHFSNLRLPSRLSVLLQAQNTKIKQASKAQLARPTSDSRAKLATALERYALVIDAMMQGRAQRDARAVARKLSEIADDLSAAERSLVEQALELEAPSATTGPQASRGDAKAHAEVAASLLDGGGRWMLELGVLGRDLGEITQAYVKRTRRAEGTGDFYHAALAAADLAARLAEPDPSFQSEGGMGGSGFGGGEAGGGGGGMPSEQEGEASEVERAFQEAAAELGNLVEQHAQKLAETERDAEGRSAPEDVEGLREELQQHAEALRKIAESLQGAPDEGTQAAKELAEQMAKALEGGDVADAVESGQAAKRAMQQAKSKSNGGESDRLQRADRGLSQELEFAERMLSNLRKKAQERGKGELGERAADEAGLAERMRGLSERAGDQDSLPEGTLDALRAAERSAQRASQALKRGDAERGLMEQREAQRNLERAKDALGREDDDGHDSDGEGNSDPLDGRADIPKADAHKGPDAFRQRVMRGLGQGEGKNRDAVSRYAEGLIR